MSDTVAFLTAGFGLQETILCLLVWRAPNSRLNFGLPFAGLSYSIF